MIFVTVGTQKFQFNRLLTSIDKLVNENIINQLVICQSGYSTYKPKNYKVIPFMDGREYNDYIKKCDLLITHAGVGTIMTAKKYKKPVIVVPRLAKYNEHVDDHQLQIARGFSKKKLVISCDANDLNSALKRVNDMAFLNYNLNQDNFNSKLENIIANLNKG